MRYWIEWDHEEDRRAMVVEAPWYVHRFMELLDGWDMKIKNGRLYIYLRNPHAYGEEVETIWRILRAIKQTEEAEGEIWFDTTEMSQITRKDLREMLQDLPLPELLLVKSWIEEEVRKRQLTPLR